jgi:hypothetical protein
MDRLFVVSLAILAAIAWGFVMTQVFDDDSPSKFRRPDPSPTTTVIVPTEIDCCTDDDY